MLNNKRIATVRAYVDNDDGPLASSNHEFLVSRREKKVLEARLAAYFRNELF
jgi:hypothetical protein